MAQVYLRKATSPTVESAYTCATLYWGDMYDNKTESGFGLVGKLHQPNLNDPFFAMAFSVSALTFTKDDQRYEVLETEGATRLTHPFTYDVDYERVESSGSNQFKLKDNIFTAVPYGIKPDDFDTLAPYYYWVKDGGQYAPLTIGASFSPTTQYYKSLSPYNMKFSIIGSGIADFEIACGQWFKQVNITYQGQQAHLYAGFSPQNLSQFDCFPYGIHKVGSSSSLFADTSRTENWKMQSAFYGTIVPPVGIPKFDGFPVAFTIPSGTTIGSYTTTTEYQMFGIVYVAYDEYGIARSCTIQAMEKKCWLTEKHKTNDFGPDTPAYGGTGKQKIGTDNPMKTIEPAKGGGILSNPTSGPGFVIYKFTQNQFTNFMTKLYGASSKPASSGAQTASQGIKDNQVLITALQRLWSSFVDMDNIVFIKNSPVNFPTNSYNMNTMSVGSVPVLDIGNVDVVSQYAVNNELTFNVNNPANDFTDLEPYKSCKFYFPLAGEVNVLPSYLNVPDVGAGITVRYGFNLLTSEAVYAGAIKTANGYINFAKEGQCAKDADIVLTKSGGSKALSSLVPVAASGIATIATGGTAAPALATTAAGAATGFVENVTDLNVVNLPNGSTSSPYYECVYGGFKDVMLYSVKAERFASGEDAATGNKRNEVLGKYSYAYVDSLSVFTRNADKFSIIDINMKMENGMTKAEYDKIIAYLKEGVWM